MSDHHGREDGQEERADRRPRVVARTAEHRAADDDRDDALEQVRLAAVLVTTPENPPIRMPTSAEVIALNANAATHTRRVLIEYSAARGFAPVARTFRPIRVRCITIASTTITAIQMATDGGIPRPKVFVTGIASSITHWGG